MALVVISQYFSAIQNLVTFWLPVGYRVARECSNFFIVAKSKSKSLIYIRLSGASELAITAIFKASIRFLKSLFVTIHYLFNFRKAITCQLGGRSIFAILKDLFATKEKQK